MKLYYYTKKTGHTSSDTDALIAKSLKAYTGCDCPEILRNENGKPYFKGLPLHIGVTHTNDTIIIAFDENNFGIDCEYRFRSLAQEKKISERYFSEKEKELPFLDVWTRKEAYAKFLGVPLFDVISKDTFSLSGNFTFPDFLSNIIVCIYQ